VDLIGAISAQVPVPLVLHGSSGVPDDGLRAAIAAGISKVNVATHLNGVLTRTVRRALTDDPGLVDPRRWMGPARDAWRRRPTGCCGCSAASRPGRPRGPAGEKTDAEAV